MRRAAVVIVGLMALLISTGCASTRQYVAMPDQAKTIEDPTKSRIYLLRPAVLGTAISMRVDDGKTMIGQTGPKSYLCWEREPGTARIVSHAENEATLELTTDAGQVYYVQQHVRPGWITARTKLSVLTEDKGKKVLERCKPPSELPTQ